MLLNVIKNMRFGDLFNQRLQSEVQMVWENGEFRGGIWMFLRDRFCEVLDYIDGLVQGCRVVDREVDQSDVIGKGLGGLVIVRIWGKMRN